MRTARQAWTDVTTRWPPRTSRRAAAVRQVLGDVLAVRADAVVLVGLDRVLARAAGDDVLAAADGVDRVVAGAAVDVVAAEAAVEVVVAVLAVEPVRVAAADDLVVAGLAV